MNALGISCPRCNGKKIKTERIDLPRGGYHLKTTCIPCNKFIKFLSHQKARLPFGRYRGISINEIAVENPSYLRWLLREDILWDGDLKAAVEEVVTA